MNRKLNLIGLMAAISIIVVLLATWIWTESLGYTHFRAGEPVASIRYTEWLLGGFSLVVLSGYFKREFELIIKGE